MSDNEGDFLFSVTYSVAMLEGKKDK